MTQPEWFLSVPLFQPVDLSWCLSSYFEAEFLDGGFETKKFYADWIENEDLQFLQWYRDWQILYDWDTEAVIISKYSSPSKAEVIKLGWGEEEQDLTQLVLQAYETNSINLHLLELNRARWEIEDIAVEIAKKFIDALEFTKPSKGQLELQLAY